MSAATDSGIFMAVAIVLYSTGHWIGGSIALAFSFLCSIKI